MGEITLAPAIIGAVSSVVTEILKFIPFLNRNNVTKSLTTIVVIIVAVFISEGGNIADWHQAGVVFVQAVVYAFTAYKMIVQPVAKESGSKTQ